MSDSGQRGNLGRRELKKEATRQDLLAAAANLFKTKGYEATSVDDIAMAADVAKGTFYYHFPAKEDLVFALQEAELKVASDRARQRMEVGKESPLVILFDFLNDSAHWTESNPELGRAMFKQKFEMMARKGGHDTKDTTTSIQHGPPATIKEYVFGTIGLLLAAAQQSKEIRSDVDTSELAQILIPVVMSTRIHWLMDSSGATLTARVERSLKILMEGFKPRK